MRPTRAFLVAALLALPAAGHAQVTVYQSNFDSLTIAHTQNPALPGHDGWFAGSAMPPAYGEIQNVLANTGQALHEYTDATSPEGLQTIDVRPLVDPNLGVNPLVTLRVDFYCASSDLNAANIYSARLLVRDNIHPGCDMLGFSVGGGNGQPKTTTGVGVVMYGFNGSNNNVHLPLTVGQHLAWDTWHSVVLVINQAADEYVLLWVDGQMQDLTGIRLPYNWNGSAWFRGQFLQTVNAEIVPFGSPTGEHTNDSVYWDNLSLTAEPAAPLGGCCLPTGDCYLLPELACAALPGSIYFGDGTTCAAQPCECTVCPENDECSGAIAVALPSVTAGSTRLARVDNVPDCSGGQPSAPGVWYQVQGTGTILVASMCNSPAPYDAQLSVYCGTCANLVCVAHDDDGCGGGGPSFVYWCSRPGATYYLRVYGWGTATGDFVLEVTDDGTPCQPSDPCPTFQRGDLNCDGVLNAFDIDPFVLALTNPALYQQLYPGCDRMLADINQDGVVNAFDIDPFVVCITLGACP